MTVVGSTPAIGPWPGPMPIPPPNAGAHPGKRLGIRKCRDCERYAGNDAGNDSAIAFHHVSPIVDKGSVEKGPALVGRTSLRNCSHFSTPV